ncbi:MAG: phosphoadenosine phosphosulfate reductase family protein [Desulfobacterales bacterium]|nr:phosphoadenosine phosphosulfate reductase family protein [Desulfobacterales bacterium]MCP4163874.1 phosphoadenosine phosphosulfate reductase family protein [Deltaproteobacteria bacterium]
MAKRCSRCVLPEVNDYVKLDNNCICEKCNNTKFDKPSKKKKLEGYEELRRTIDNLKAGNENKYDCIVAVSGGKDSLMTLYYAKKKLGLNPLAVFIDNGFSLKEMYLNINNAVDILDVDLIIYKTQELKNIARYLLLSKKPIYYCRICHALIDLYCREIATKYNIPLILGGFSKGQQYMKNTELKWIFDISDKHVKKELSKAPAFKERIEVLINQGMYFYENFPNVYYCNPLQYVDYDIENNLDFLIKEFNFRKPKMSWPKGSTNCKLNFVSQYIIRENFGYGQHESELSTLVREDVLSREKALEIIETPISKEDIESALSLMDIEYDEVF